jgi:hypothetical protein
MKIILSPIAASKTTTVSLNGSILTIDGQDIDLSVIPVGGEAEPDEGSPFIGKVTRDEVTIRYEYNSQLAEHDQASNWDDYTFDITEGDVPCPIKWRSEPEVIEELSEEVEDV